MLKLINNKTYIIAIIIILFYISALNIFVFRTSPEIIALQFAIILLFLNRTKGFQFTKDWIIFISIFVAYEYLRGIVDDISPFKQYTLYYAYHIEKAIFGTLPTVFFQKIIKPTDIFLNILLIFYSAFFYYSFVIAFFIWLKSRKVFWEYTTMFVLFTYIGLLMFFLLPTAPPWMIKEIDTQRYLYQETILHHMRELSVYYYYVQSNEVAAFPSLHIGWPLFSTLFLIIKFRKLYFYPLLIVPAAIWFCVVITSEHYIIDGIPSIFLAFSVLWIYPKYHHNIQLIFNRTIKIIKTKLIKQQEPKPVPIAAIENIDEIEIS